MDNNIIQGSGDTLGTDTYTVVLSVGVEVLVDLAQYNIRFVLVNTGATTLNVNGIGAKAILTNMLIPTSGGTIMAGSCHILIYSLALDSFVLQSTL